MKEAFNKVKEQLTKIKIGWLNFVMTDERYVNAKIEAYNEVIEIVDKLAEEYNNESVNCDLISRSALLKTLNEYVVNAYDCGGIDDENVIEYQQTHNDKSSYIIQGFSEVYGLLQDVPTVYNNGWIPCSERLPADDKEAEYYQSVIVTLDDGRVGEGCYRNRDKEWWVDAPDGEHYSQDMTGHVIAWQPLPKPYKPK